LKHLVILAAAVIAILGAWLVLGLMSGSTGSTVALIIPTDQTDKISLIRSAHQLWKAKPNYYDSQKVFDLIRLLDEQLDDEQWRAVSAPVFYAWENHRAVDSVRGLLVLRNKTLLPRWTRAGTASDLEGLVRAANQAAFDAAAINEALGNAAAVPVQADGYEASRISEIVAASIRARDLRRAKTYLAQLHWGEGVPGEARVPAEKVNTVVDLCLSVDSGKYDLVGVVRAWGGQDSVMGRTVFRPILEEVALRSMQGRQGPRVADLFADSANEEKAEAYWDKVIVRFIPRCAEGDETKNGNLSSLLVAFGAKYKRPDFAFRIWMKVAALAVKSSPEDPLRAVLLFERALSMAVTDAHRVAAAKGAAEGYAKALEFRKAVEVLQQIGSQLHGDEEEKEFGILLEEAKKKEKADQERVAKQEVAIDLDRRRGRLQAMKDKLVAAKRSGRPGDELRAIEGVIHTLEKELTE